MAKGDPENEYKIASENMRWYSNIRFAQLTLFFALTAGFYNEVFSFNTKVPDFILFSLKIGGILSSFAFAYLEKRADDYWLNYIKRACVLEKVLGYKQYSSRPDRAFATSTVILILYGLVALFWLLTLVIPYTSPFLN
jgi:hypothetical protein